MTEQNLGKRLMDRISRADRSYMNGSRKHCVLFYSDEKKV